MQTQQILHFITKCYERKRCSTLTGFPQTFDNWIQGLFKDFQGQQQQFSRIYLKARPPLPPLLAIRSSHKIICHIYIL